MASSTNRKVGTLQQVHETDHKRHYTTPRTGAIWFWIGIGLMTLGFSLLLKTGLLTCRHSKTQQDYQMINRRILTEPIILSAIGVSSTGLVITMLSLVNSWQSLYLNRSAQQLKIIRGRGPFSLSRITYPSSAAQYLAMVQRPQKDGRLCHQAILERGNSQIILTEGSRYAVAAWMADVQCFFGFPSQIEEADQMPYRSVALKETLQVPFQPQTIAVSRNGQWLATGGVFRSEKGDVMPKTDTLQIWNLKTRQLHHILQGNPLGVSHLVFSPDGRRLATSYRSETIALYDVITGTVLQQLSIPELAIHKRLFMFMLDSHNILFAGQADRPPPASDSLAQRFIAATRSDHHVAQQWDLTRTPPILKELLQLQGFPTAIAISPDGQYLAAGFLMEKLRVWHLPSHTLLTTIEHAERVTSLLFSPDNRYVLYGSDFAGATNYPQVGVYDITQKTLRKALQPSVRAADAVRCVAISPDGRIVAVVQAHSRQADIRLVDFESGDVLDCLIAENPVREVVFLPDGRSLLTVSRLQAVDIWQ